MWRKVIKSNYGEDIFRFAPFENPNHSSYESIWLRDLSSLKSSSIRYDLFFKCVGRKVGNGRSTLFWHDTWVGDSPLKIRFGKLFSVATFIDSTVANNGVWVDGVWNW